jgi:hypothetical protein
LRRLLCTAEGGSQLGQACVRSKLVVHLGLGLDDIGHPLRPSPRRRTRPTAIDRVLAGLRAASRGTSDAVGGATSRRGRRGPQRCDSFPATPPAPDRDRCVDATDRGAQRPARSDHTGWGVSRTPAALRGCRRDRRAHARGCARPRVSIARRRGRRQQPRSPVEPLEPELVRRIDRGSVLRAT